MATATIAFRNEHRLSSPARRSSRPTAVDAAVVGGEPGASVSSHFPRATTMLARLGAIATAPGRLLHGATTHSFCTPTGAVCVTADGGTIGRSEWFRLTHALGLAEAHAALAAEGLTVAG
jgi:hypothetical protein